ncbi:hypothetical protein F2Q68_00035311 [Brassica cretica]|uniref:Uncharacterized protein n=1 Tax=Brassica cretica TaxID=69181 RepID=A0A8S9H6U5_BRACR|nr:hypothetical protein F2Q68_00035311 [Brassica cretica]
MSPELRGLMETLCRGSTHWLSFTPDQIQAAYALPPELGRYVATELWLDLGRYVVTELLLELGRYVATELWLELGRYVATERALGRYVATSGMDVRSLCENRATPVTLVASVRSKRGQGTKRKKDEEVLLDRPDESSEPGSSERDRKVHRGRVLRPRSQAQSPGLLARPVSVAIPSGGARKAPDTSASSAGDRALNDEIDSLSRQSRRRVLEELTLWLRDRRARDFLRRCMLLVKIPILENPESLAAIWCKIRAEGCELPSLEHMRERGAYVQMAVANAKAMEASNDYAALMEGRLANFPSKEEIAGHLLTIQQLRGELDTAREVERQRELDFEKLKKKLAAAEAEKGIVQSDLNSMEEKYRREIEGRDRKAPKDLHLARVSLAKEYEGVLAVVRGKLEQKKKETAAEILLQETRAHIEALTEYSEGGFELEAELERLKDLEVSLDVNYGLASVSDPSLGRLDLPEISGDSVNQD